MDFVNRWSGKTGIAVVCFLLWLGIATSKWHSWKDRYGKANEHNAWIPRDHWLEAEEKQAIIVSEQVRIGVSGHEPLRRGPSS